MRRFLCILALLLVTSPLSRHAVASDGPCPNVLLLHSYHHGFVWSDQFTEGVLQELQSRYPVVRLDIQYLDEKRVPGTKIWPQISEILSYKYQNGPPDIILAADDPALKFLLKYYDDLFQGVPVVFGGLTHDEEGWHEKIPRLTGIIEEHAVAKTVELALDLHPGAKRVVVVNDSTTSGLQRHVQAVLDLEALSPEIVTEHWIDLTSDELVEKLSRLDANDIVLIGSFFRDARGEVFSGLDIARLASEATSAPIYTTHGPLLGGGVVGGYINQGKTHGRETMQLALRVLDGEDPATIPVKIGPSVAVFDHLQLVRFGIAEDRLPAGSEIINQPSTVIELHPRLVAGGALLLLVLLLLSLFTAYLAKQRKDTAAEIQHNLELLQTILDSVPDPIFYKDAMGRYLGCNAAMCRALGLTRGQIVGKTVYEVAPSDLARTYHQADIELMAQGGTQAYETQVRFADGRHHDVLFHKAVFPGADGRPAGMVGAMLDISERKEMENALQEGEERFRTLFQAYPDPMVLTDQQGAILDVNRGFEETSGIPKAQALGKNSLQLGLWQDPADRDRLLAALHTHGAVSNLQFEMVTATGARTALFSARLFESGGKNFMLFGIRDITELRRAQQALTQSELRLRTVFDTSPDGILISRAGGGEIVDVNTGFTQLWGYAREEVLGHSSVAMNLWADNAEREAMLGQLARAGKIDNFEIRIRCKDGTEKTCSASCRLVELDGVSSTLAVFRDISHLKGAEEALRASEEKFHAVFHQTYQFMGILDPQGRVVEVNDTALDLLGLSQEQVAGKYFWETPWWEKGEQREMVRLAVETAAGGNLFQVRTKNFLKDGTFIYIDFSLKPVFDEQGVIRYLIPEGRDITGLQVAENALRESESRYRDLSRQFQTALDGVPDAMMIFAPDRHLLWGNQQASKVFGLASSGGERRTCEQIWGFKEKCHACRQETFVGGQPWEEIIEPGDGQSWGVKTFPILDEVGKVANVLQIATDLTEKIRLREQASRSAHLAALGEVAAGVAHEINNPAGLLLMDLGLLQDVYRDLLPVLEQYRQEHGDFECGGLPVERVQEQLPPMFDELLDGAQRIKRIVEELKDFANPYAESALQQVNLNEVVEKALRLTRKSLKLGANRLELVLDPDLPLIAGNVQRLEQVVINLLLNAVHALSERGEQITIVTRVDPQRRFVELKVCDDGCGISSEKLSQITDPFFTTRREQGGTGLGLSVSSRIIDEHHGTLHFDSTPGKGTTVTVQLPLSGKE